MNNAPPLTLVNADRAQTEAKRLFDAVSKSLAQMLPLHCEIRHVGATAVAGCLTKGDLDIVVRVPAKDFTAADAVIASRFPRNEGSVRSETFSAFEDASCHPHLGIQLVSIDGPFDCFHVFVEALNQSSQLVEKYNALKRLHAGMDMECYRAAKSRFIEKVLAGCGSPE